MKRKQILVTILILLFSYVKSNFFTYGIRKALGFTLGSTGIKDSFISGKSCSQSSQLSSFLVDSIDDYETKKRKYLEAKIISFTIGLIPLGINLSFEYNFYGILKNGFGLRQLVPCYLGGCTFYHHALALLYTDQGYFIIEYGAYLGKDDRYPDGVIYYNEENGARFTHINYTLFYNMVTGNGTHDYSDKTIYTHIRRGITIKDLFQKISLKMNLTMHEYNAADNSCQDFIANAILILNAKRVDKTTSKMHNFSKLSIPPKILEALEYNEDYQILTSLAKIPLVGVVTDFFGSLVVD